MSSGVVRTLIKAYRQRKKKKSKLDEGDVSDAADDGAVNDDGDDEDENEGVPIDRGWSWVICFCVFMVTFIQFGHDQAIFVLFVDLVEEFQQPASVMTSMFTIFSLTAALSAVATSNFLMPRVSTRQITLAVAVSGAALTILVSQSPTVVWLLIFFGTKGICFGALLVCPSTLLGFYFKRNRSLATAIANSGLCAAFIIFPAITHCLREEYGLRGTLLIIAAIEMHLVPLAMLLRPVDSYKKLFYRKQALSGFQNEDQLFHNELDPKILSNGACDPTKDVNRKNADEFIFDLARKLSNKVSNEIESIELIQVKDGLVENEDTENQKKTDSLLGYSRITPEQCENEAEHTLKNKGVDASNPLTAGDSQQESDKVTDNASDRDTSSTPFSNEAQSCSPLARHSSTPVPNSSQNDEQNTSITSSGKNHDTKLKYDQEKLRSISFSGSETTALLGLDDKGESEQLEKNTKDENVTDENEPRANEIIDSEKNVGQPIVKFYDRQQSSTSSVGYARDESLKKYSYNRQQSCASTASSRSRNRSLYGSGAVPFGSQGSRLGSQLSFVSAFSLDTPYVAAPESDKPFSYAHDLVPCDELGEDGEKEDERSPTTVCCRLQDLFDFSLLKIWPFRMVVAANALGTFTSYVNIYMPTAAVHAGLSKPQAAALVTVVGATDFVSRLVLGFLADMNLMPKSRIVAMCLLVICLLCQLIRFYQTYADFLVYAVFVGLTCGCRHNLLNVILIDHVGLDRLGKGLGICSLVNTLLLSANHPVIGALLDVTGSFVIPFHVVGTVVLCGAILFLCEPFFLSLEKRRIAKENNGIPPAM